jgi:hypothetical protein
MVRAETAKLILHVGDMLFVRYHIYIAWIADGEESLVSRLKERLSGAKYIKELLGFGVTAVWPEAAPHASRHEDYIKVFVHYWNSTNRSKTMKILTNSGR